jgi:hypothetical protein
MEIYRKNNMKSMKALIQFCVLAAFLIIPVDRGIAQPDSTATGSKKAAKPKTMIDLFGSDELLDVSIYMDLEGFLKSTSPNASFNAEIIINNGPSDTIRSNVKLKYRGILRRSKEVCSFPPILVVFNKPLYEDSVKIKKLKLVTHCQPGSITDEYVLREYLVYKMFNAMTDTSFRARLLKVNYMDVNKKKKTVVKYGIFLEPLDMLAKRINTVIVKSEKLNSSAMMPRVMDRLAIFNYMVANWDWSVPGQHNVKILQPMIFQAGDKGIVVPYDFDLTGVVNANYAVPPPNVPISSVRQRLFWGPCRDKEVYRQDLMEFAARKADIYAVIENCQYLSKGSKKDILYFLDEFFDQLEKSRGIDYLIDDFLKTCKY